MKMSELINPAIFTLMILSGCSLLSSDSDGSIIAQIDSVNEHYILGDETLIGLQLKNVSSKTIYYSTCGSGTIHELKNFKMKNSAVYTNPCYCICIISIEPDEVKELSISGYLIRNIKELQFTSDFRYRILPHFYNDQGLENRISLSAAEMKPISIIKEQN